MTPTINPAFRSLIPPLAPEELAQLEKNIMADGCRDPLVTWNGILLDGHNRLDICMRLKLPFKTSPLELADDQAAQIWIIRNQFGRRNIAPFTRVELVLKLEPMLAAEAKSNQGRRNDLIQQVADAVKEGKVRPLTAGAFLEQQDNILKNSSKGSNTRRDLAKAAGVSEDTIAKGKLVSQHADEKTKEKLRNNQVSVHRVARDIKEKLQRDSRAEKRKESAKTAPMDNRIIVGDFRKKSDAVPDGSVSLIFTDPPYDREASKMLPALAEFASNKLADGGSLILYCGHLQLPDVFTAFAGRLRHWWTCACVHSGPMALIREYGIRAGWKPMVWFVKGTRDDKSAIVCDTVTGSKEKDTHDWQQAESEAVHWISALCPTDGIVCDPFLGGGTTAVAAKRLARNWVGFEIDQTTAERAGKRISQ